MGEQQSQGVFMKSPSRRILRYDIKWDRLLNQRISLYVSATLGDVGCMLGLRLTRPASRQLPYSKS